MRCVCVSLSYSATQKGQIHGTLSNTPWLAERRQYSSSWGEPFFCFVNSAAIILPLPANNSHTLDPDWHTTLPSLWLSLSLTPIIVSHKQSCCLDAAQLAYKWSHMGNKLWASGEEKKKTFHHDSSWGVTTWQTKLVSADVEKLDFRELLSNYQSLLVEMSMSLLYI